MSWGAGTGRCACAPAPSGSGFQLGGGGKGFVCPSSPLPARGSGGTSAAPRVGSALLEGRPDPRGKFENGEGGRRGFFRAGSCLPVPGGGGGKEAAGAQWRGRGGETDGLRPVPLRRPLRPSVILQGLGGLVGASEGDEGTSVSF